MLTVKKSLREDRNYDVTVFNANDPLENTVRAGQAHRYDGPVRGFVFR